MNNVIVHNKRAKFEYYLEDSIECGIMLHGYEVKSVLAGKINIRDSYVKIIGDEAWLIGCRIEPYGGSSNINVDPTRSRKLLLKKNEIMKLVGKMKTKGITLIADAVYLGGYDGRKIKIRVWTSKGKTKVDKKRAKKEADILRSAQRTE